MVTRSSGLRSTPRLLLLAALSVGLASGQGTAAEEQDDLGSRIDDLFQPWRRPDSPGASIAVLRAVFARLRFERDPDGRIRGFRLDGSRVLNLAFTKLGS